MKKFNKKLRNLIAKLREKIRTYEERYQNLYVLINILVLFLMIYYKYWILRLKLFIWKIIRFHIFSNFIIMINLAYALKSVEVAKENNKKKIRAKRKNN